MINPEAVLGIFGMKNQTAMQKLGEVFGENPPPALSDPESIGYAALSPELLADQIVFAIDQPWGVSISDLTVRASGDDYVL